HQSHQAAQKVLFQSSGNLPRPLTSSDTIPSNRRCWSDFPASRSTDSRPNRSYPLRPLRAGQFPPRPPASHQRYLRQAVPPTAPSLPASRHESLRSPHPEIKVTRRQLAVLPSYKQRVAGLPLHALQAGLESPALPPANNLSASAPPDWGTPAVARSYDSR